MPPSNNQPDQPDTVGPPRFQRGDWEAIDEGPDDWPSWLPAELNPRVWDNPNTRRLRLREDEYEKVADAVVRQVPLKIEGHEAVDSEGQVRNCYLDLRKLYDAVAAHPDALLARAEPDDNPVEDERQLRRIGVFNIAGEQLDKNAQATTIALLGCVVESCKFSGLDIQCTLKASARFAGDADFRYARFAGAAWFEDARFAGAAGFGSARFAGAADFVSARFAGAADFGSARFAGAARFGFARFAGDAGFGSARFAGAADFWSARFAGDADFGSARFAGAAGFGFARFAGAAGFWSARFAGDADFGSARFAGAADFGSARFAGDAGFRYARFAGDAWFEDARFAGAAGFQQCRVTITGRVLLTDVRFEQSVSFNDAKIRGGLFFSGSTLDERLTFNGATFGSRASLGFKRFLPRGGATIEITIDQLDRRAHFQRLAASRIGLGGRHATTTHRRIRASLAPALIHCSVWVGLRRMPPLMQGDDSIDPAELRLAADDYELLAANFKSQPATDREEDHCRWRAHEHRRLAAWHSNKARQRRFLEEDIPGVSANVDDQSPKRWATEFITLMWYIATQWAGIVYRGIIDIIGHWLIQRTAVGYLLQIHRIVVSGAILILTCALIYALAAGDSTIIATGSIHPPYPWDGSLADKLKFGLYFSLTTFVTLGYGDYAPTGWLKVITGIQALLGVTLLALFTVAWGRKLVR